MKKIFQLLVVFYSFNMYGQDTYKPLLRYTYLRSDSIRFSSLDRMGISKKLIKGFSILREDNIKDFIEAQNLDSIAYLFVYNKDNKSLDSLFNCLRLHKSLKYLSIEKVDTIPKSIGKLSHLKWLSINDSWVTFLPDEIGNLIHLETLSLGYPYKHFNTGNRLSKLPSTMSSLKRLTRLYIWGNDLKEFPEVICQLDSLEVLDISGNELENIPKCLLSLRNFKQISIRNNPLKEIPLFLKQGKILISD